MAPDDLPQAEDANYFSKMKPEEAPEMPMAMNGDSTAGQQMPNYDYQIGVPRKASPAPGTMPMMQDNPYGGYSMPQAAPGPRQNAVISNSVLAGIGNPVPVGRDKVPVAITGAGQYAPIPTKGQTMPRSSGGRVGSNVAANSVNSFIEYDPFHVNAQRYQDF